MPTTHPSEDVLRDFLLGKLTDAAFEGVESHLADCPHCLERAGAATPTDTLVELLASARTRFDDQRSAPTDLSTPTGYIATHPLGEPLPPPSALAPPHELANHPKYRLLAPLGAGGMGSVWLAEHLVMGRTVAVKVIRPEWAARPGAVERFRHEVRAVARLAHEHIATAHDAEQAGDRLVLVMEYVPGESLAGVARRGPLPAAEACRAARDAARGLAHAHAAGVIHRDVKPSNLVRTPGGVTKVLDFGLASAGWDEPALAAGGVLMGTPDYIAPEQAADPHAADPRSDIYALGCTLYHLLSGRVPYPVEPPLRKIDAHRDPAVQPPSLDLLPRLAEVVAKMMAKAPADRYQTAEEVAVALEPWANGRAEGVSPLVQKTNRGLTPPTRRWAIAAGLLFAVIAFAGGAVYKIQRDNEQLTIATDDPDIEVVMKRNGELVRIVDAKTKQAWELDTKKLRLKPDGGELTIDLPEKGPLVVRRNGDVAVTVTRQPAKAPERADLPVADAETVQPYRTFSGHTNKGWQAVFSPDAKTVYSCGWDGFVRVWDVEAGKETAKYDHKNRILRIAVAEGGKTLLAVTSPLTDKDPPSRLFAWDTATGKEVEGFPQPPAEDGKLSSMAVSPDGKRAAVLSLSGVVRVYDIAARKQERTWEVFENGSGYVIAWSPNGELLAVAGGCPLSVWEASGKNVFRDKEDLGDTSAVFSADGKSVFAAGWDGMTRRHDRQTWTAERSLSTKEARGSAAMYLDRLDANRLLLGGNSADVRVWDIWADKLAVRLSGGGLDSISPAASADGRWVTCGSEDGKVRVWKLPDSLVGKKR